ncbi:hypothetical protein HAX54_009862 [Datura stramonium]|uniref:Uncharacterized protein n=1 Tax=Datura stramonium TaxID=4076 RepID=A0ABS8WVL2_DATST|nr:hypothetical protein [Datura stramonium]
MLDPRGNDERTQQRNQVHDRYKRRDATDMVVKQAMAAWGDISGESEEGGDDQKDISLFVQEDKPSSFDSIFALMANSDSEDDDEVNFLDIQKRLKTYSKKEL